LKLLQQLGFCVSLLLCVPALASQPPEMRFATEDWPPFFSHSLPGQGLTGMLLNSVLERMGYTMRIDYFPGKRAVEVGRNDPRYAGVVALFRTPEREKLCHFSSAIGSRQTVLAFLANDAVPATTLADLQGIRIGTVAGYSNGEQFDSLVLSGLLKVEVGVNDEINLRKLLHRRFTAIVIEKHMLRYLLTSGRYTQDERERIAIAEHLFSERSVHVCFQRTSVGMKQRQAFDDAAREIELAKLERDYWQAIGEAALMLQMNP
jgi:polar amino acid transport system substrate-binding protein